MAYETKGQKAGPEPPIVSQAAVCFVLFPWPRKPREKIKGQMGPSKKKNRMIGTAIKFGFEAGR